MRGSPRSSSTGSLNAGGFAGLLIGLGQIQAFTGPGVTMDLSVGFRVTDWFRIDAGAFALAHHDYLAMFPYLLYVGGKFILFGK